MPWHLDADNIFAIRHQAFTWTNPDQVLWCHVAFKSWVQMYDPKIMICWDDNKALPYITSGQWVTFKYIHMRPYLYEPGNLNFLYLIVVAYLTTKAKQVISHPAKTIERKSTKSWILWPNWQWYKILSVFDPAQSRQSNES